MTSWLDICWIGLLSSTGLIVFFMATGLLTYRFRRAVRNSGRFMPQSQDERDVSVEGRRYLLRHTHYHRKAPAADAESLWISGEGQPTWSFVLSPQSRWDETFARLRLSHDVRIGHTTLDRKVHVATTGKNEIREFLRSAEAREAVLELIAKWGAERISMVQGNFEVLLQRSGRDMIPEERLRALLAILQRALAGVRAGPRSSSKPAFDYVQSSSFTYGPGPGNSTLGFVCAVSVIVSFTAALLQIGRVLEPTLPLVHAALLTSLGLLPIVILSRPLLSRWGWNARSLALVIGATVIGGYFLNAAIILAINFYWPPVANFPCQADLVARRANRIRLNVQIPPEANLSRSQVSVSFRERTAPQLAAGRSLPLTLKTGTLGYSWLEAPNGHRANTMF